MKCGLRLFAPVSSHLPQRLIKLLLLSRDVSLETAIPNLLSFYYFGRMLSKTNKSADWWSDEYGRSSEWKEDDAFISTKFLWTKMFFLALFRFFKGRKEVPLINFKLLSWDTFYWKLFKSKVPESFDHKTQRFVRRIQVWNTFRFKSRLIF